MAKDSPALCRQSLNVNQTSQDQINSSTGAPLNDNRFLIRRARLGAFVDQQYLAGVLEIDANTVNGAQVSADGCGSHCQWPGGSVPLAALTVGLFKIPFGFEVMERDLRQDFHRAQHLYQGAVSWRVRPGCAAGGRLALCSLRPGGAKWRADRRKHLSGARSQPGQRHHWAAGHCF